ncbi:DUF6239 family natural product biosynthesis protein [Lentzea sp. BCCO 10_0798]|uniref:DUF6239 family natural product biosynthesis protein n=1 Tax=Lentzea kristufekii TaxID=3095430 RepID=A0ABU4U7D4_9PSEU|nr:DUF6239 family natural product biosynthesis protein [Lentzea sp. BCCO 10_0798]MDX8056494.1 DUF6239 family natural product biosynthesis protein [Lentzea sp. BCCO 10_0798]
MHDHGSTVPVVFGPVLLYLIGYLSVPAVAGFALMRIVTPPPRRVDALLVTGASTTTFLVAMLLYPSLALPPQAIVLLLAAGIVPFVVWWRAPHLIARVVPVAPCLVAAATTTALLWATVDQSGGYLAALTAVSWLTFCVPRSRAGRVVLRLTAGTLALSVVAFTGTVAASGGWL